MGKYLSFLTFSVPVTEGYQDNFNKKLNFATNPYGKLLKSTHLIFLDPLSNKMISPN